MPSDVPCCDILCSAETFLSVQRQGNNPRLPCYPLMWSLPRKEATESFVYGSSLEGASIHKSGNKRLVQTKVNFNLVGCLYGLCLNYLLDLHHWYTIEQLQLSSLHSSLYKWLIIRHYIASKIRNKSSQVHSFSEKQMSSQLQALPNAKSPVILAAESPGSAEFGFSLVIRSQWRKPSRSCPQTPRSERFILAICYCNVQQVNRRGPRSCPSFPVKTPKSWLIIPSVCWLIFCNKRMSFHLHRK
jgi:hypothetical protein